jgi:hypothetical protein
MAFNQNAQSESEYDSPANRLCFEFPIVSLLFNTRDMLTIFFESITGLRACVITLLW